MAALRLATQAMISGLLDLLFLGEMLNIVSRHGLGFLVDVFMLPIVTECLQPPNPDFLVHGLHRAACQYP